MPHQYTVHLAVCLKHCFITPQFPLLSTTEAQLKVTDDSSLFGQVGKVLMLPSTYHTSKVSVGGFRESAKIKSPLNHRLRSLLLVYG